MAGPIWPHITPCGYTYISAVLNSSLPARCDVGEQDLKRKKERKKEMERKKKREKRINRRRRNCQNHKDIVQ
jgi:hypothetical protein